MKRISASTWAEIRTAYAGGIGLRELARNMGIPAGTVLARSKREGWTQQIAIAKLLQRPELARELAKPEAIMAITPMQSAAISTQERKAQLLTKSLRIADKAADRIEDQIDGANITQATIAFGVATEKSLLLAGEPTQIVQVNLAAEDIYSECRTGICSNPHPPLRDALPRIAARRDFGSPTIHAAVVRVALVANIKNRPCRSPFKADEVRHLRHDSFLTGTSETK